MLHYIILWMNVRKILPFLSGHILPVFTCFRPEMHKGGFSFRDRGNKNATMDTNDLNCCFPKHLYRRTKTYLYLRRSIASLVAVYACVAIISATSECRISWHASGTARKFLSLCLDDSRIGKYITSGLFLYTSVAQNGFEMIWLQIMRLYCLHACNSYQIRFSSLPAFFLVDVWNSFTVILPDHLFNQLTVLSGTNGSQLFWHYGEETLGAAPKLS